MRKEISIHPMLLFIDKTIRELCTHVIFQYIPCYCLSERSKSNQGARMIFQYIPCYCLSNEFNPFLLQAPSSFPLFYAISTFFTSRL